MSTVLRLLASLEHAGLAQRRPEGKYTPGPEVVRPHGIGKQRIAVTIGDWDAELAGIPAPGLDGSGWRVGAVTLSMPVQRFWQGHERIVPAAGRALGLKFLAF